MNIEQTFRVPYPTDQVWRFFHDVPQVVSCLPGAVLAEPPAGDALKLGMTVKLGPIVAAFAGNGTMTLDEASRSGRMSGGGTDRKSGSRVKGEAAFSLHEEADAEGRSSTRVDVGVDYAITGALAQFSRGGIVRDVAQRLTQAFAENLKQKLDALALVTGPDADPAAPAAAVRPPGDGDAPLLDGQAIAGRPAPPAAPPGSQLAAPPLDLGNFFWPALWARIKRFLGMGRDEPGR